MRRIAWTLGIVLGSAGFMLAQSSTTTLKMSGTICLSSCVVQVGGFPTCDKSCTDNRGVVELIEDEGTVMQVSNQDICRSHLGKHVQATVVPTEKARERELEQQQEYQIMEIHDELRPGAP